MTECPCKNNLCALCACSTAKVDQALAGPGPLGQVQSLFVARWAPVFEAVCPAYGLDPDLALRTAISACNWGDTALGSNVWALEGTGDAGHVVVVRTARTGLAANGGIEVIAIPLAKFSSDTAAVQAWCRAVCGANA